MKGVFLRNPDSSRHDSDDQSSERERDPHRPVMDTLIEPHQQRVTERPAMVDSAHRQQQHLPPSPPKACVTGRSPSLRLAKAG
jgi:hypothetical protein